MVQVSARGMVVSQLIVVKTTRFTRTFYKVNSDFYLNQKFAEFKLGTAKTASPGSGHSKNTLSFNQNARARQRFQRR